MRDLPENFVEGVPKRGNRRGRHSRARLLPLLQRVEKLDTLRGDGKAIAPHVGKEVWRLSNEEFTGLMRQYQNLVYTVCLQFVHDPHTAEDLTQDTFLAAFSAIDRCDPQYHKQWLVRVAANKCKDHLKSAWVREVQLPGDEAMPPARAAPQSEPDYLLQSRYGAQELETLVRSLREPYGRVATMYLLEKKNAADIAAALHRPVATVNSQLHRARVILQQQIAERRQKE